MENSDKKTNLRFGLGLDFREEERNIIGMNLWYSPMKKALPKILLTDLNISTMNIHFLLLTKKNFKKPEEEKALVRANISLLKSVMLIYT